MLNSNKNAVQIKPLGAKYVFVYFGTSFMEGFGSSVDRVAVPAKVWHAVSSGFSRCSVELYIYQTSQGSYLTWRYSG